MRNRRSCRLNSRFAGNVGQYCAHSAKQKLTVPAVACLFRAGMHSHHRKAGEGQRNTAASVGPYVFFRENQKVSGRGETRVRIEAP